MRAIIVSIGDELALGLTVDTNSAWVSQQLAVLGCDVVRHATVADDQAMIATAIREEAARCDVLIVSGGLGPTEDDLTRQALADVLGSPLELRQEWVDELKRYFDQRGRVMPERNHIQAMIPQGATLVWNHVGTASGIEAKVGGAKVFVVPGVPKEMKRMVEDAVLPHVKQAAGGKAIVSRTFHTFGLGESAVAEKLGGLMDRQNNPTVGTTVSGGIVSVRVFSRFDSVEQANQQLETVAEKVSESLGELIFATDNETLHEVVGNLLKYQRRSVAVAESCTGGLLGKYLTDQPGSSVYFKGGFITYSNESKYERLGVNMELLNVYGAVSEQVVDRMARSARRLMHADYGIAISGIAGPDGGSDTKPVGTVCIGLAHHPARKKPTGTIAHDEAEVTLRTFNFPGDREMIRDRAAKMAMTLLRYHLLGKDLPF